MMRTDIHLRVKTMMAIGTKVDGDRVNLSIDCVCFSHLGQSFPNSVVARGKVRLLIALGRDGSGAEV